MLNYSDKYELIMEQRIEELKTDAYLLRHKKSGARVAVLQNDDENKVFSIGFRTPPKDSTGVPHILEHSVLCGSTKYPAKDPFIELAKGSLNTFLNAMTYPDKTVYPIASCNDKDFDNIMDVYMDAVFNPNIYSKPQIFMQEGWHYELEDAEAELKYNGVVYNEMKGAFSSPQSVLARYCLQSLYPDTDYSVESGGDPKSIPDLTYEAFVGFHKKLYHPSNSYIYLYGNCNMEDKLKYIDEEYLCKYDTIQVDSEIKVQKPFESLRECEMEYSVTEQEGTENKTYFALNWSVSDALDVEKNVALSALCSAIFSVSGAPVKQALIDAGIGSDVDGSLEPDIRQAMVNIVAENASLDQKELFVKTIMDTLRDLADNGVDRNSLLASLNTMEFEHREANYGRFPKGLMYGLSVMGSWIYDENKPFINLMLNDIYAKLRDSIETGYFENLIRECFLDNPHASLVIMKPVVGLTAVNDKIVADKLAAYKSTLSPEEINRIVEDTKALKQYQSEPSTEEELKKIPVLAREDISKDVLPIINDIEEYNGTRIVHHDIYTNGIGYLTLAFDAANIPDDELQYFALLSNVLGDINTKKHSYFDLTNEIAMHTGGISFEVQNFKSVVDFSKYMLYSTVECKAFVSKFDKVFEFVKEIMNESLFDDAKRLKEILSEDKTRMQASLVAAGHSTAKGVIFSQMDESGMIDGLTRGVEFYNFMCELLDNFDERQAVIVDKFKTVCEKLFARNRLIVSFTGDKEAYSRVSPLIKSFIDELPDSNYPDVKRNLAIAKKRIGYKTAAQVNYVARGGNYRNAGLQYEPSLKVFDTMLSYDYLWNEVRVKGGAYGCMDGFGIDGASFFVSYRDPNVGATNKIYEGIPEYIDSLDIDEREMTKYIIGTFSSLDVPLTPVQKGKRSFTALLTGLTEDDLRERRMKILSTHLEDIKKLKPYINAILDDGYLCVVGNEDKIENNNELFDEVKTLL